MGELLEQLKKIAGEENVLENEPMRRHTTFKIGGKADFFVTAAEPDAILGIIKLAKEENVPLNIIGRGSNLLVSDEGVEGIVLAIRTDGGRYMPVPSAVDADTLRAVFDVPAGIPLATFAKAAAKKGYTGTETLAGIPGTVGGAVAMNAGAYGGEIKNIIKSALVIDENLELVRMSKDELELEYRNSAVLARGLIVVSAEFELERANARECLARVNEYNEKRRDKQPLEYPSAGSTFKRPEGYFAGKLIEDAGMRGYKVGGAMVSEKHCGFVINTGKATASDVKHLMSEVSVRVFNLFKVRLEPEVRLIGR